MAYRAELCRRDGRLGVGEEVLLASVSTIRLCALVQLEQTPVRAEEGPHALGLGHRAQDGLPFPIRERHPRPHRRGATLCALVDHLHGSNPPLDALCLKRLGRCGHNRAWRARGPRGEGSNVPARRERLALHASSGESAGAAVAKEARAARVGDHVVLVADADAHRATAFRLREPARVAIVPMLVGKVGARGGKRADAAGERPLALLLGLGIVAHHHVEVIALFRRPLLRRAAERLNAELRLLLLAATLLCADPSQVSRATLGWRRVERCGALGALACAERLAEELEERTDGLRLQLLLHRARGSSPPIGAAAP